MGVVHLVLLFGPAHVVQLGQGIGCALCRSAARYQTFGRQAVAARFGARLHGCQANVVKDRGLRQRCCIGQGCARLVEVAKGGVLSQGRALAARIYHHASGAALQHQGLAACGDLRDWFTGHHAVHKAIVIQLGRAQHRRTAVGCRARQHHRVGVAKWHGVVLGGKFAVEHIHGVAACCQGIAAPILLWVLLRVCVFDGDTVGEGCVVGSARSIRQLRCKKRQRTGIFARSARSVDLVDRVVCQVVQAHALACIGQGHRTALFQPPLARCTNGTIHAARARRWPQHQAGASGVKAVRHHHRNHGLLAARAVVQHRQIFAAGDQALAASVHTIGIDIGAVQAAIAAAHAGVQNTAVVRKQGVATQLGHGGVGWVDIGGWCSRSQACFTHAASQQILRGRRAAAAYAGCWVMGLADFGEALGEFIFGVIAAAPAAGHQGGAGQGCQSPVHAAAQRALLGGSLHVISCVVVRW